MKILLIHNYYQYPGGEDTYFESLKKLLTEKGHEVITFTKNSKSLKTGLNIIKTGIGLFHNPQIKKELTNLILKEKPDIAQIQNIFPVISPTIYKVLKQQKIPIIQRITNYRWLCPKATLFRDNKICTLCLDKQFKYPAIKYNCYQNHKAASAIMTTGIFFHRLIKSLDLVDHFIFPTKFVRDLYLKHLPLKLARTSIIPTFTLIDKTKPVPVYEVSYKKFFLFVGQFTEQKGIVDLLKVFTSMKNMKLVVVGDGPLCDKVKTFASLNIHILNWKTKAELSWLYQNSLATIIPSKWHDPLPNVMLEASLFGTPVVASYNASFSSFIKSYKIGFLYKELDDKFIYRIYNQLSQITKKKINKNFSLLRENHYIQLHKLHKNLT